MTAETPDRHGSSAAEVRSGVVKQCKQAVPIVIPSNSRSPNPIGDGHPLQARSNKQPTSRSP